MRYILLIITTLFFIYYTKAQSVSSEQDKNQFDRIMQFADKNNWQEKEISEIITLCGGAFLSKPYKAGTCEIAEKECLIINLRAFDCVTFVESMFSLALCIKNNKKNFSEYERYLQKIRYRNGKIVGYPSRLHYFSDWIFDNINKKLVNDITSQIGGIKMTKKINFMTVNYKKYKHLKNNKIYRDSILAAENRINKRKNIYFIPKTKLHLYENKINSGDIIAIATSINRLDFSHTGIAYRIDDKLHLLHASSSKKKVVISKKTLNEYLNGIKSHLGIAVIRPL